MTLKNSFLNKILVGFLHTDWSQRLCLILSPQESPKYKLKDVKNLAMGIIHDTTP